MINANITLVDGNRFRVHPGDINTQDVFWIFDSIASGKAACYIVRLCQKKCPDRWPSFKCEELEAEYRLNEPFGRFDIGSIMADRWIQLSMDNITCYVTQGFVEACYKAYPANLEVQAHRELVSAA